VWALGCILVELCTLNKAFESSSMSKIILAIMRGAHRPLPDCYSEGLRGLVAALLRVSPAARPSVQDVLKSGYVK
jgi:NIMA (never in mitosis gene a)-related kinase